MNGQIRFKRGPEIDRRFPRPIGGILDSVVRNLGISRSFYGWQVVSRWPEIVGESIAHKAEAIRFDEGTLFVAVPDAAWRHQLQMQGEDILRRIHEHPRGTVIRELRFVAGRKG